MKKRIFDILSASIVGAIAAPAIAGTAAAVLLTVGRPILYREERIGKNGIPFTMYKFRTMSDRRDEHGELLPDAQRTPRIMRYIRKSGLDELPQLWNILKGDMSMVGPRPHSAYEFENTPALFSSLYNIKPGLTGPSQVLQISKKIGREIALEAEFIYAANPESLREDVAIMRKSLPSLIRGHAPIQNDL